MNPTVKTLLLLVLPALLGTACIPFDEAPPEFCRNADTKRRQEICGEQSDRSEQTSPDGGSGSDAGTETSCTDASHCNSPPGECYAAQGACMNGRCEYLPKPTGDVCHDAIPPTQCFNSSGTCSNGVCIASVKPRGEPCDDGNSCTSDTCDGAGSCSGLPSVGTSCDDHNPCTLGDQCNSSGACSGTLRSCSSPHPNQCYQYTGTCNTSTGACEEVPKPNGSACNDGNACTTGDSCDGNGACLTGGTPLECFDIREECLISTGCSPASGCTYRSSCTSNQHCQEPGICCANTSGITSSNARCL
ncbi:hypothetical protein ATI61_120123 [Archangium gephyra]|uniref:Dickkopf N-terminal cysteine-rich domain-containing protein n=1 Tax=Archangium gephyra TaxID=48 RepID=A0ABX9JM77_9BACT|nr:hypothetical protein ATI61_120123 [Archangium gephyra]